MAAQQHQQGYEPPYRPLAVGVGALSANPMAISDMKKGPDEPAPRNC
jgi:hypothetical protein